MSASEPRTVFLLSGGSGRTVREVFDAALAQFAPAQVRVQPHFRLRSTRVAEKLMASAAEEQAIVVHSLVASKIRDTIRSEAARRGVIVVDVLGPLVTALSDHLQVPPKNRAGLSYQLNRERFERIDSVDFTLAHDDGRGLSTLAAADVVLVGPSRVSKSVTCFYLAARGVRAANIPLISGHTPPDELLELDPSKVVALTMNAARLKALRSSRLERWQVGEEHAYDQDHGITEELRLTERLVQRYQWHRLDVSYLAVEEVAQAVLDLST